MRLLFVGDVAPYQTTEARRDAFLELGVPLETVNQGEYLGQAGAWMSRLSFWTLATPAVARFNRAILERARAVRPDVIWIEKGVYVFPRTLRALRRETSAAIVYHNTDDWRGKIRPLRIHWRYLLRSLDLYDVHVSSNLHNVNEFRAQGYPRVHHMELAANRKLTIPEQISPEDRGRLGSPVGFIGHWEAATEELMLHLLANGIDVKIFGQVWEKAEAQAELSAACQYATVWGDEYARASLSFDINLGIVSKLNRSHTATRTFQIPALGAFMLHERNELVTQYYREGVEAEFFDSKEELLEKCRHYLAHPEARRRIAEAGRRRCIESGYFETDRVREVIPVLEAALRERAGSG